MVVKTGIPTPEHFRDGIISSTFQKGGGGGIWSLKVFLYILNTIHVCLHILYSSFSAIKNSCEYINVCVLQPHPQEG